MGDALDGLVAEDGEFDVVYNDVDKHQYPDCWRADRGYLSSTVPLRDGVTAALRVR